MEEYYTDNTTERLDLVKKLFEREDRQSDGIEMLKKLYPEADERIIHSAAFNLFLDGPDGLIALLADIELFLQGRKDNVYGSDWDVLYHIYNWKFLEKLLYISKKELISEFYELEAMIKNKENRKSLLDQLERVKDLLDGAKNPPDFD